MMVERRMHPLTTRLSTGENNTPAIRLYESIGFKIVNRYIEYVQQV